MTNANPQYPAYSLGPIWPTDGQPSELHTTHTKPLPFPSSSVPPTISTVLSLVPYPLLCSALLCSLILFCPFLSHPSRRARAPQTALPPQLPPASLFALAADALLRLRTLIHESLALPRVCTSHACHILLLLLLLYCRTALDPYLHHCSPPQPARQSCASWALLPNLL